MTSHKRWDLKPRVIKASAGTGKTFQLSNRYLALLLAGERPDRILATTFTRKAAGEILERIYVRLAKAAVDNKGPEELARYTGVLDVSRERVHRALEALVSHQHRISIMTMDSFFVGLAKQFTHELDLPLGWSLLDEHPEESLREEAVRRVCSRLHSVELSQLVQLLSFGDAARSVHEQIFRRIASLYSLFRETDLSAWNWLEVDEDFSQEDFSGLLERLESVGIPSTKSGKPSVAWEKAIAKDLVRVVNHDWKAFLNNGVAKAVLSEKEEFSRIAIPEDIRAIYLSLIQRVKTALLGKLRHQTLATLQLLTLYSEEYRGICGETGSISFDDLKFHISRGASVTNLEEIFYRLDSRIHHLLLDEFQDTSRTEWQAISPLAEEILATADSEHSFFCVGDPKQSIYAWRGGVPEILHSLEETFSQLESDSLEKSYRSSPVIIEFVNKVFSSLVGNAALGKKREQIAAADWMRYFSPHSSANADLSGYVALYSLEPPEELDEDCQIVSTFQLAAEHIVELLSKNSQLEIGVLVRRNRDIPEMLHCLAEVGVLASEEGGNPLTDSEAVRVMLSFFTLLDHPGDSISRFHVANSPLGEVLDYSDFRTLDSALSVSARYRDALLNTGFGPVINKLIKTFGGGYSERDRSRLLQLGELGYIFDSLGCVRVRDFVSFVRKKRVEDPSSSQVRIMTIHQSKGLEFDAVFMPELERDMLKGPLDGALVDVPDPLKPPTKVARGVSKEICRLDETLNRLYEQAKITRLKEELSVFYVALTRARQAVYLYACPTKRTSVSFSSILFQALGIGEELIGLEFESGDPEWMADTRALERLERGETLPFPKVLLDTNKPRQRLLSRKSPSKSEKISVGLSNEASLFGTVVHAFFEKIEWVDKGAELDPKLFKEIAFRYGITELKFEEYFSRFSKSFQSPAIRSLFMSETYANWGCDYLDVSTERRFAYSEGGGIVVGTLDRLVIGYRGDEAVAAEILDYKTDRLELDEVQARAESYSSQLDVYRFATAKLARLEEGSIKCRLAFLSLGVVV